MDGDTGFEQQSEPNMTLDQIVAMNKIKRTVESLENKLDKIQVRYLCFSSAQKCTKLASLLTHERFARFGGEIRPDSPIYARLPDLLYTAQLHT